MIKRIVVKAMVIVMWISLVSSEVYACPTIRGFPTSLQNHLVYEPVRLNGNIGIEPLENQRITGWSVDWGDGSKVTTGTGLVVDVTKKDGYSKVGDYTIVITVNWEYYDKKAKVWKPGDPDAVIGNKSASIKVGIKLVKVSPISAVPIICGVGETLKDMLKVKAVGYGDKSVKNVTVSFSLSSPEGGGGLVLPSSMVTKGNGEASTTLTIGDKEGEYVVTASSAFLIGEEVTFKFNAKFGSISGMVYEKPKKSKEEAPLPGAVVDLYRNTVKVGEEITSEIIVGAYKFVNVKPSVEEHGKNYRVNAWKTPGYKPSEGVWSQPFDVKPGEEYKVEKLILTRLW